MAEHRDRDAMADVRRAVYLSPYDQEAHLLLGTLLQRGGHLTEAIDELKIAVWSKETGAARAALASAYFDNGDKDAAKREAQRALAIEPENADARALLKKIGGEIISRGDAVSRSS